MYTNLLIAILTAAIIRPKFELCFAASTLHFNEFLHASADFGAPSLSVYFAPDVTKTFFADVVTVKIFY